MTGLIRHLLWIHSLYSLQMRELSGLFNCLSNSSEKCFPASLAVMNDEYLCVCPKNLVGPDEMFLLVPLPRLKVVVLSGLFPLRIRETHLDGFIVKSRSAQSLETPWRALA